MPKHSYSDEQIAAAVQSSCSLAQVLNQLGLMEAGGNYTTIKRKIRDLSLDTAHFTGQRWRRGNTNPTVTPAPIATLLVANASCSTYKLKRRLLMEGLKRPICESCALETWQGKPIPLELHHKNGDNTDFRMENIQLLCPNCHALTDNYRGKNKRIALKKERANAASSKTRARKFDPTRDELNRLVWEMPTVQIARQFGVSDNAVARRCKLLDIVKPPRGYWAKQAAS